MACCTNIGHHHLIKKGRHKHDRSVNEHALLGGLSSSDVVQIINSGCPSYRRHFGII